MALEVSTLRELFRHLQAFHSAYESDGIDTITDPDTGDLYCLWDLDYLRTQLWRLPPRQRQAIELCLIRNLKESDAAKEMGVSPTNPVSMYATSGLQKLVDMVNSGALPRFREAMQPRQGKAC